MVRWAQMCVGTSRIILEDTMSILHMEGKWFRVLIQDLQTIQGKLHLVNRWTVKPQHEND
eukprot:3460046-Ditylum_brightwellii.AAC.1